MDVNDIDSGQVQQQEFDELMMRNALNLAERGSGHVSPNPMVGAVIVDATRHVIAEGWHETYGAAHAEVNALSGLDSGIAHDLSSATMYVTLEPCNHYGHTPPCTEAILASGIRRVVVGMRDPNPMVGGTGIHRLREAGVRVEVGLLESEARDLNEAYIHVLATGHSFITIKIAQTIDGFTALPSGESQWITGESARRRVHKMRAIHDGVMVGTRTAIIDNPTLTLRHGIDGRQPWRITLDRGLDIPTTHHLLSDEHCERTILFTTEAMATSERGQAIESAGVRVVGVPLTGVGLMLPEIFRILAESGISSVLVEGGSVLAGALIRENLAQKLVLFVGPKIFGVGFPTFAGLDVARVADAYSLSFDRVEPVGEDIMMTLRFQAR